MEEETKDQDETYLSEFHTATLIGSSFSPRSSFPISSNLDYQSPSSIGDLRQSARQVRAPFIASATIISIAKRRIDFAMEAAVLRPDLRAAAVPIAESVRLATSIRAFTARCNQNSSHDTRGREKRKYSCDRRGFTASTSSMDVPRPDVAAQKRKHRIIIISAVRPGLDTGHLRDFALEAGGAERRSFDRLGRLR